MNCPCDTGKLQSFESALAQLLSAAIPIQETEIIALDHALGRVVARDMSSSIAVPPADNSAMDGYAVRYADIVSGQTLPISQRIAAGQRAEAITPGTVVRLFTGSEIPEGADTVIMQEESILEDDGVRFTTLPKQGDHIRRAGQDINIGDQIIAQGTLLAPQHLGVLASIGIAEVSVYRRLKVAVLNTGDELVMPGASCPKGKIYNSNYFTLAGLLTRLGCDVWTPGVVKDTPEATAQALAKAAVKADVIISSGGVSVGEEDHVKAAVESLGSLNLWRLAIKPGKPLAFGEVKGTPFIGLPGNPSAVLVTFLMLARPYLMKMQGHNKQQPKSYPVLADFDRAKLVQRKEFLRVSVANDNGRLMAIPARSQSSGVLSSAVMADGLLVIPELHPIERGASYMFIPFTELGAI